MSVMTMNNCENENDIFHSVDMTDLPPDIKGACAMCIVHRLKGNFFLHEEKENGQIVVFKGDTPHKGCFFPVQPKFRTKIRKLTQPINEELVNILEKVLLVGCN